MRKNRLKIVLKIILFAIFCYFCLFKFACRNVSEVVYDPTLNSLQKNVVLSDKNYSLESSNDDKFCNPQRVDWKKSINPTYKLNPDKLLFPTFTNGPTNQLVGFHQSVLLSIMLNR